MPTKTENAVPGDLLRYRIHIGTFHLNATRKIVRILDPGQRFILEGRDEPIVEAKHILSVLKPSRLLNNTTSLPANK